MNTTTTQTAPGTGSLPAKGSGPEAPSQGTARQRQKPHSFIGRWIAVLTLALLLTGGLANTIFAQTDDADTIADAEIVAAADEPGVLIVAVQPDSPAAQAGLVRGDILLTFDDVEVNDAAALIAAIGTTETGATVEITWLHGPESRAASVELDGQDGSAFLGVQPYFEAQRASTTRGRLSEEFSLRGMMPHLGHMYGHMHGYMYGENGEMMDDRGLFLHGMIHEIEGLMILEVVDDSPAAQAGLARGQVIASVNGEPVDESQALQNAVQALAPGAAITLTVYTFDTETVADEQGDLVADPESLLQTIEITLDATDEDAEVAFLGIRVLPTPHAMPGRILMREGSLRGDSQPGGTEMHRGMLGPRGMRLHRHMHPETPPQVMPGERIEPGEEGTMGRFGGWDEGESRMGRWVARIPLLSMFHGWFMDRWGGEWHMGQEGMPMFRFFAPREFSPGMEVMPRWGDDTQEETTPPLRFELAPRNGEFF